MAENEKIEDNKKSENEKRKDKMIFVDLAYAVKSPSKYKRFLDRKAWQVILYGVLLIAVYFLLANVLPMVRFQRMYGNFQALVERHIPEFELKNGRFYMEPVFFLDESRIYVDVDTSMEWVSARQDEVMNILKDRYYMTVIISDSRNMAVKSNDDIQFIDFQNLYGMNFGKKDLYRFIPVINTVITLGMILWYLFDIALFFFGILILSLIGLGIKSAIGGDLSFGKIYCLSVYARTLPLMIKMLLALVHIRIPFFWLMSIAISAAYLNAAFKKLQEEKEQEVHGVIQTVPFYNESGMLDRQREKSDRIAGQEGEKGEICGTEGQDLSGGDRVKREQDL
ncbi:DUF1189 domain-containing protein [Lachnospiraceae bacterium 62-35]